MKKILLPIAALSLVFVLCSCSLLPSGGMFGEEETTTEVNWESLPLTESLNGSHSRYYYNQLSVREKHAYNNVLAEAESFPEMTEIPSLDEDSLLNVFEALTYDNPTLFFLGRSCRIESSAGKYFFFPDYSVEKNVAAAQLAALKSKAQTIVSQIDAGASESEKERVIHDYLVKNVDYQIEVSDYDSNAYGAIVLGKAACEGYSKAFLLLADMVGIESYLVSGTATNSADVTEFHMWNIVKIDGDYYHVDVTWDDPVLEDDDGLEPRYTYYNVDDTEVSRSHTDFESLYPCTATKHSYYVEEGLYFETYDRDARKVITEKLISTVRNGGKKLEFKMSTRYWYSEAYEDLFTNERIYSILDELDRELPYKNVLTSSLSYLKKDNHNVLELIVLFEDGEEETTVPEPEDVTKYIEYHSEIVDL